MTCPARARIIKESFLGDFSQELGCLKPEGHKGAHLIRVPPGIRIEGTKGTWSIRL